MPSYLSGYGMGRTFYRMAGWSNKKVRGAFSKGYQDGAFNGWPAKWSPPAVPASVCYQESGREAQTHAIHIYTVGFYMGAAASSPGPKVPDPISAEYHSGIAEVRVLLF